MKSVAPALEQDEPPDAAATASSAASPCVVWTFAAAAAWFKSMRLTVNGRLREVEAGASETLLSTLRDRLSLTGAKAGCERGECGACTVHVDGAPVYSCLTLTRGIPDATVTTIEGIAQPAGGDLHPVQVAFIACDAVQCGYCTPGQVMAAISLLEQSPDPTDDEIDVAMSGNLCRCGTYPKIRRAIRQAATAMRGAAT